MVLVSEHPGEDRGAIGVVTLEDVIEELIGEEIVDETDVYVDVSRHLRRMGPSSAYGHHSFHRISSRHHRGSQDERTDLVTPTPANKAAEPKPTQSSKVTIKPGIEGPHVLTHEERLLGKKAARESYGSPQNELIEGHAGGVGSGTLIEEFHTSSEDGQGGKVVISPLRERRGDDDDVEPHSLL
jgi:hypothetical protein